MDHVDAVAVLAATRPCTSVRVAASLVVALLALALGAIVGLGWKPLVTAQNPVSPSFAFGPVPGSVTQSIAFPGGPVDTVTIWARSGGARVAQGEAHLLRSQDGPPVRSARFEALPDAELQVTPITFAPTELPAGRLALRVVVPEHSPAALYVGATLNNAYAGGELLDHVGRDVAGVDLAFSATGHAGALTRLRAQASRSPAYLLIGLTVALLAGTVVGTGAWSALDRERFGRLAAVAVCGGVTVATILGLLHGPGVSA